MVYFDEHTNPQTLQEQSERVMNCLLDLGFCINRRKNPNINKKNRISRDKVKISKIKDFSKNSKSKQVDLAHSENPYRTPTLCCIPRPTVELSKYKRTDF